MPTGSFQLHQSPITPRITIMTEEELSLHLAKLSASCKNEEDFWDKIIKPYGLDKVSTNIEGNLVEWKFFGNDPGNASSVTSTNKVALLALIEKIINSQDAVMMKYCLQEGIDPTSKYAPQSVTEAMQRYFGASDWADLTEEKIKSIQETLVVMENAKINEKSPNPTMSLLDNGCGVAHCDFEDTFLSTGDSIKDDKPFLSGQFSRGGISSFNFGEGHSINTIMSKPAPSCYDESKPHADHWSFVPIMKLAPSELMNWGITNKTSTKKFALVYLTINGKVPHFPSESLDVSMGDVPVGHVKLKKYGFDSMQYGTWIRLFDFKINEKLQSVSGASKPNLKENAKLASAVKFMTPFNPVPINMIQPLYVKEKSGKMHGDDLTAYCGLEAHLNPNHSIGRYGNQNHRYLSEYPISLQTECGEVTGKFYFFKEWVGKNSKGFLEGLGGVGWKLGTQWQLVEPKSSLNKDWEFGILSDYTIGYIDLNGLNLDTKADMHSVDRETLRGSFFDSVRKRIIESVKSSKQKQDALEYHQSLVFKETKEKNDLFQKFFAQAKKSLGKTKGKNSKICTDTNGLFGGDCGTDSSNKKLKALLTEMHLITKNFSASTEYEGVRKEIDLNANTFHIQVNGDAKQSFYEKHGIGFKFHVAGLDSEDWSSLENVCWNANEAGIVTFNVVRDAKCSAMDAFKCRISIFPNASSKHHFDTFEFEFECQNVLRESRIGSKKSPNNPKPRNKNTSRSDDGDFDLHEIKEDQCSKFEVLRLVNFDQESGIDPIRMTSNDLIGFESNGDARRYVLNLDHVSVKSMRNKLKKEYPNAKDFVDQAIHDWYRTCARGYEVDIKRKIEAKESQIIISTSHYSSETQEELVKMSQVMKVSLDSKLTKN
jgi:uncharacterized protein YjbJ (UPF0337 family)